MYGELIIADGVDDLGEGIADFDETKMLKRLDCTVNEILYEIETWPDVIGLFRHLIDAYGFHYKYFEDLYKVSPKTIKRHYKKLTDFTSFKRCSKNIKELYCYIVCRYIKNIVPKCVYVRVWAINDADSNRRIWAKNGFDLARLLIHEILSSDPLANYQSVADIIGRSYSYVERIYNGRYEYIQDIRIGDLLMLAHAAKFTLAFSTIVVDCYNILED